MSAVFNATIGVDATSSVDIGDNIANSLMLDSASSQYLSRTPAGAGSQTTWTMSLRVKRGALGAIQQLFSSGTAGVFYLLFQADDTLKIRGATIEYVTAAKYRDPSAHTHIVLAWDSSNATAGDRARLYINGSEVTSFSTETHASASEASEWNKAQAHNIGRYAFNGTQYFDGYLSNVHFIDGQALTPSDFGRTSADTGQWVNKTYAGTYGTNGFKLDFTNSGALGTDSSGNGNNWTLNSITSANQYTDTPMNNHSVFNKLSTVTTSTLSVGNTKMTASTIAIGSLGMSGSMKSYWEVTSATAATLIGMYGTAATTTISVAAAKTYGMRFDAGAGTLDYINITDTGSWTSLATGLTATPYFQYASTAASAIATINSGSKSFVGTVPSGYLALNTANLPTPPVVKGTTAFVAIAKTAATIDADLATARTGWSSYVDIKKNRTASGNWQWQFSHDASNEHSTTGSTNTYQAKSTNSGANNWMGYSIRIGAAYGTAAGSVSHTNGADTTVTHNLGITTRQVILLFSRTSNAVVPFYHPDLTAGSLLNVVATAAQAASLAIKTVTSTSFKIDTGQATATYDYLVLSDYGICCIGNYIGNNSADGPWADNRGKPVFFWEKDAVQASNWGYFDSIRDTYNAVTHYLFSTAVAENVTAEQRDFVGNGCKIRSANATSGTDNVNGNKVVYVAFLEAPTKYSTGR